MNCGIHIHPNKYLGHCLLQKDEAASDIKQPYIIVCFGSVIWYQRYLTLVISDNQFSMIDAGQSVNVRSIPMSNVTCYVNTINPFATKQAFIETLITPNVRAFILR